MMITREKVQKGIFEKTTAFAMVLVLVVIQAMGGGHSLAIGQALTWLLVLWGIVLALILQRRVP